jgi:tetratricopeptide (TPR) repeat protein
MGCVYEPFLALTPNVGLFTARLIFNRFTFGEAAYACQASLSWQTTVVGDPLYRPFGTPPAELHARLLRENSPLAEWSNLQIVNLGLNRHLPMANAEVFLEQTEETRRSAVLSEKLGDICDVLGKPSSAVSLYQQALALNPSREQRLRLRLTLGEKLAADGRDLEAYEDYRKLIDEWPDYPGKLSVCEKLLALAGKLGKNDEAAKWQTQINLLNPPPAPPPTAPAPAAPPPQGKPESAPVGPVGIPPFAPAGPASPPTPK